jgi:hypothetical protein
MCLGNNGVFVKDGVYHLGGHDDFYFAVDGFRTRVDDLAGFPFCLILRGGKRQEQVLSALVGIL